ncbi:MAG: hypothetical protein V2I33_25275 [Kangiellaceae bacterium]|nr:hypothetical protein [Kangiellaceae bacterium]
MIRVLRKAVMPSLCDWTVTWSHPVAAQEPDNERVPNVYYNESFNVFALLGTSPPEDISV